MDKRDEVRIGTPEEQLKAMWNRLDELSKLVESQSNMVTRLTEQISQGLDAFQQHVDVLNERYSQAEHFVTEGLQSLAKIDLHNHRQLEVLLREIAAIKTSRGEKFHTGSQYSRPAFLYLHAVTHVLDEHGRARRSTWPLDMYLTVVQEDGGKNVVYLMYTDGRAGSRYTPSSADLTANDWELLPYER